MLVRAKLPKSEQGNGDCKGCGGKRCGVCKFLKPGKMFADKDGKEPGL